MIPENEIERWITLDNGVHVPVKKGMSNDEATEAFIISKLDEEAKDLPKEYSTYSLPDLMNKEDEDDEVVNDAYDRVMKQLPDYDYYFDKVNMKVDELYSLRQDEIDRQIENLNEENIKSSKISHLLGNSDRRMSSYGDRNMSRVIDKIDNTVLNELNKFKDEIEAKGLDARVDESNLSESKYLNVYNQDGDGYSFRISDHEATGSGGTIERDVQFIDEYGYERTIEDTISDFKNQVRETISDEWNIDIMDK